MIDSNYIVLTFLFTFWYWISIECNNLQKRLLIVSNLNMQALWCLHLEQMMHNLFHNLLFLLDEVNCYCLHRCIIVDHLNRSKIVKLYKNCLNTEKERERNDLPTWVIWASVFILCECANMSWCYAIWISSFTFRWIYNI